MKMDTDQLIRSLAADNPHRARPVGFVLTLALLAAAPVSVVMFFARLGFRPDVMTAIHNPFFDLKFVVTLALASSAIAVSLHLSRPEASLHGWAWLLLIPAGLLATGIGSEMMMPQRLPMMTRLVGSNSKICLQAPSPGCYRRDLRRRYMPRTAPTIRRCSWRPGTRSLPRWSLPSVRWRDRGCYASRLASIAASSVVLAGTTLKPAAHAAGAAACCMR
jgi:hypothetical protein